MTSTAQFPTLVMIIRHGEKPGDPANDKDGGPDLSILGSGRALALPSLFTPDPTTPPVNNMQQLVCKLAAGAEGQITGLYGSSKLNAGAPRFPIPAFLFATSPTNGSSSRPLETITPLLQALQFSQNNPGLTINDSFTNDTDPKAQNGVYALASEILGNPSTYAGQIILISWHHGTIPLLTERFGVPASQLPWTKWPPTVFDLVFYITWPSEQALLRVYPQQLLYGDTITAPGQSS